MLQSTYNFTYVLCLDEDWIKQIINKTDFGVVVYVLSNTETVLS